MNRQAFQSIESCLYLKNPHLDLSECDLTNDDFVKNSPIDSSLRRCIHIRKITLDGKKNYKNSKLSIFPSALFSLPEITELIFRNYRLSDISFTSGFTKLVLL